MRSHSCPIPHARGASLLAALLLSAVTLPAMAQVAVRDAWVRGTVAQQKATGAFMQLESVQAVRLVSVTSPVAAVVEIHEMSMADGVMKMRAVPALELPAGKAVDLKPGGFHVMLMGLKQVLKDGDTVPLTLVVEGADKSSTKVQVDAAVRPLGAPQPAQPHRAKP